MSERNQRDQDLQSGNPSADSGANSEQSGESELKRDGQRSGFHPGQQGYNDQRGQAGFGEGNPGAGAGQGGLGQTSFDQSGQDPSGSARSADKRKKD